MKEKVLLIGAGGHCKIIIECLDLQKYEIVGILDNFVPNGTHICGIPVIGSDEDAEKLYKNGIRLAVVTIVGNLEIRRCILNKYRKIGFQFPNIIHEACRISPSARIGEGVVILANVCVNAEAKVGDFVTLNTGSIIEHEVSIGENSHIAPGAILLGASQIGCNTMIGAGATVLQQIYIGNECKIGAGSVVLHNIEDKKTVYGIPAK